MADVRPATENPIRSGYASYCGQIERYRGKFALVREYENHLEAQFDEPCTGMHLGWHPFMKSEFVWHSIYGSKFRAGGS